MRRTTISLRNVESLPDAELVDLILKNKDLYKIVVDRYEAKLLRYMRRITNIRPEDIEDCLQEVFLKAYLNLNDYNKSLSFSSWIYRIGHNEVVSFWRKKKVKPDNLQFLDNDSKLVDLHSLADELDIKLNKQKINEVLSQMPLSYREILVLRFFEEREYKEISDILKIPPNTVGVWLNRAKRSFGEIAKKKKIKF